MPRAKRGPKRAQRRKKVLKLSSGFFGVKVECLPHGQAGRRTGRQVRHRDRRAKKRQFRALWIVRINAAVHEHGLSYNRFIQGLKLAGLRARSQGPGRAGGGRGSQAVRQPGRPRAPRRSTGPAAPPRPGPDLPCPGRGRLPAARSRLPRSSSGLGRGGRGRDRGGGRPRRVGGRTRSTGRERARAGCASSRR